MALRTHHLHNKQPQARSSETGAEAKEPPARQARGLGYRGEDQVNGELSSVLLSDRWIFA